MDKLKYVKLEKPDGSYSESIPLAVNSDQVDVGENNLTSILNTLATKKEVQAVANGGPAGVYSTVTALTTADPDHNKIYIVTENGHWYYYSENTWTDGGLYQAIEVENKSITPIKTNFFGFNDKLTNITISNERLSSTGGSSSSSNGYHMTDYIPVEGGEKIYLNGKFDRLRYYNANKVSINSLIDDTNLSDTEKEIPIMGDPIKYIRIDWKISINDIPNINLYDMMEIKQLIPIDEIKNARTVNGVIYNNLSEALNSSYSILENEFSDKNNIYLKYLSYTQPILYIYMKTYEDYWMRYEFKHMIENNLYDIWRLKSVRACIRENDNTFTDVSGEIVHQGSEWECALKEASVSSFIGGSTHGYEFLDNITFILDGIVYINPASLDGLSGKELRIIRKSDLYRYGDLNTKVATHYVDYLFTNNNIVIDNRINWLISTTLGISFMTMLGLKRTNTNGQVSSWGIREGDGALLDISTIPFSYGSVKHCRKAYAFNDSILGSKTFTSVELLEDDFLPNSSFHFEDGENYNKFYFDHCGTNYSVTDGDIWHTKSQYKIDYFGEIE